MREIKFQVFTEDWKGVKKCFDCYSLYLLEEIPLSFGKPKDGRWYKVAFTNSEGDKETVVVDRDKIRMFTGLKDKNGKEIYEGDLLTDYGEAPPLYVEYSEEHGAYCFVDKFDPSGTVYYTPLMIYYEQMEVIGNIFQDGDLLRDS
ncbi:YopX family protein [Caldifermentibacillus hisashii]|uniref:YopX family protein n=1 Tax=Caldifermentibacillus hisashii TaxID=996558 RepID=UPI001C107322|nr:YopX family protein [Caldifermentibacillus hisashii]MBU5342313.1 YopX family protein [Caldifermentibacillus hisashii]